MPVYEYKCGQCSHLFSHFWRSMADATSGQTPGCPKCGQGKVQRVMSAPTVLGRLGGLTPQEQSEVKEVEEKIASITPKSQLDQLQANRAKPES